MQTPRNWMRRVGLERRVIIESLLTWEVRTAGQARNPMERPEDKRSHEHGEKTRPADLPPHLVIENKGAAPKRNHEILCEENKGGADAAKNTMHLPPPAIKQGLETVHDGGEH